MNSWPMMSTSLPKTWLPCAWSKWKCVLMTVRTGLLVMSLISSSSTHAAAGDTWSSTTIDVVVVDDDRGVPDHGQRARADGVVDALLDLVEPERLPGVKGAGRLAAEDPPPQR